MFKLGFFSVKEHGKTRRSKSLDHLNASRSSELKKEGKLARLRRTLSFSERHGTNKSKDRSRGDREEYNGHHQSTELLSSTYTGLRNVDGKELYLTNFPRSKRTYSSCCDLRSGNNLQFQLGEQHKQGEQDHLNSSTKHRSMLFLSDSFPLVSIENRDTRKEVGIVKPLNTSASCDTQPEHRCHSVQFVEGSDTQVQPADDQFVGRECRVNNALSDQLSSVNECRHQGKDFISYPPHRASHAQSLNPLPSSDRPCVARRSVSTDESLKECSCTCGSNLCISNLDESGKVLPKGNKLKKYIIVKRHYTNRQLPADRPENFSQKEGDLDCDDKRKQLFRAKSESSLLRGSRDCSIVSFHHSSYTSKPFIELPRETVVEQNVRENLACRNSLTRLENGHAKDESDLVAGRILETSIDDLLPPMPQSVTTDDSVSRIPKTSTIGIHGVDHGASQWNTSINPSFSGDDPYQQISNIDMKGLPLNKAKEHRNTWNSREVSESNDEKRNSQLKQKKWRKKKRRVSAPIVSQHPKQEGRRAEATLPLLHIAAKEGDTALMKTLIDIGVDLDEEDTDGWPALHHAVQAGQFDAAGLLIKHGGCLSVYTDKFWDVICGEHAISATGCKMSTIKNEKLDVYFHQAEDDRYVPRAVLVDLEPGTIDAVRGGHMRNLFRPENLIVGSHGAGNNWAKGHLTRGATLVDPILDMIRKESELCDCLQGFQLLHSLGGGTGSGLGTNILIHLRDEYPDRMLSCVSVLPSPKVSDVVVEPYNSLLALDCLLESCDEVFCMDNEALYNICLHNLKKKRVCYSDLNGLVARTMSGITTSLRFPGQLNSDLRKLAVNMIPFPRLHFFLTGLSPLVSDTLRSYQSDTVNEITKELFKQKNMMCDCNPDQGRYLTFAAMYRGKMAMRDVDTSLRSIQLRNSSKFVEWIPNNAKVSHCDVPPVGLKLSATFIANNTAIQEVMRRIKEHFLKMFRRRAFVHWYLNEGLDILQFTDADSNISDLISEYQQLTEMTVEDKVCGYGDLEDSLEDVDSGLGV